MGDYRLQRKTKYISADKGLFKFYNRRPTFVRHHHKLRSFYRNRKTLSYLWMWFVNLTFLILLYFLFHRSCFVCLDCELFGVFLGFFFFVFFFITRFSCIVFVCHEWEYLFLYLCVNLCFRGGQYEFHIIRCSCRFHSIMMGVTSGGGS
jgi:hypothetical protein